MSFDITNSLTQLVELEKSSDNNPYFPHYVVEVLRVDEVTEGFKITTDSGVIISPHNIPIIVGEYAAGSSLDRIYLVQYNFTLTEEPLYAVYSICKFSNGLESNPASIFQGIILRLGETFDRKYNSVEKVFIELEVEIAFPYNIKGGKNIPLYSAGFDTEEQNLTSYFVITKQGINFHCECYWWGKDVYHSGTNPKKYVLLVDPVTRKIFGYKLIFE